VRASWGSYACQASQQLPRLSTLNTFIDSTTINKNNPRLNLLSYPKLTPLFLKASPAFSSSYRSNRTAPPPPFSPSIIHPIPSHPHLKITTAAQIPIGPHLALISTYFFKGSFEIESVLRFIVEKHDLGRLCYLVNRIDPSLKELYLLKKKGRGVDVV
jgi:hypothetical protein